MSQGIFNFEIEKVFKEINNDDLNKNYLGVFPSDKINKFAMFEKKDAWEKICVHNFQYKQKRRKQQALVEYFEHFYKK